MAWALLAALILGIALGGLLVSSASLWLSVRLTRSPRLRYPQVAFSRRGQ